MTATSLAPGLTEVTIFGGAPHFEPNQSDNEVQSVALTATLTFGELNQCLLSLHNRPRGGLFPSPRYTCIFPCHVKKRLANESKCTVHSNKVFPIRSAASYGCNQLAVYMYTTDHTADLVYTGTGNIPS